MLRRAVPGHHIQHHDAEKNAVLHSEHHHPLYGHLLSYRPHILPAFR